MGSHSGSSILPRRWSAGWKAIFTSFLAELKAKRIMHEQVLLDVERRSRELSERERLLAERSEAAERQRRETLEKSWQEAKEIVQGAKREMNAIMEEARREKGRAARERIRQAEEEVEVQLRELHPERHLADRRYRCRRYGLRQADRLRRHGHVRRQKAWPSPGACRPDGNGSIRFRCGARTGKAAIARKASPAGCRGDRCQPA